MTTLLPPLLVQQGCQVVPGRATAQETVRGTACTPRALDKRRQGHKRIAL
jgi:hypothetical protein